MDWCCNFDSNRFSSLNWNCKNNSSGYRICVLMIGLPFILKFFLDDFKKLGIIRLHPDEITVKYSNLVAQVYSTQDIENFQDQIDSFTGETKLEDLLTGGSNWKIRSGSENKISWKQKTINAIGILIFI